MKKKILAAIIIVFIVSFFSGCAAVSKETSKATGSLSIADISDGLPSEGLWRENLVLYDMNGDGFLDIVAPPPRKPHEGQNRPFVFLWNAAEKKWKEGNYRFPETGYAYGGIAVGDMNGDGYPDIALAQHGGKITLLLNDKANGFVESPLPVKDEFRSRAIVLSDINGDGRLDIIAASESPFSRAYKAKGILVGINRGGNDWEVTVIEESANLHGDSIAVGDMKGEGHKDIALAVLSSVKEDQRLIWLGDGKGNYRNYEGELFDGMVSSLVRMGDVDGDGKDEAAFGLAGVGQNAKGRLAIMKWTGEGFKDIASGLDPGKFVLFDLADIDGDGKAELVVLNETGFHIYKYDGKVWGEQGHYPVPSADVSNVTDLRAGRNKDGSVLIVLNNGKYEGPDLKQGIKAYLLR